MQKVKQVLKGAGRHKHDETAAEYEAADAMAPGYDQGYGAAAPMAGGTTAATAAGAAAGGEAEVERPAAASVAEVPVVVTERERVRAGTGAAAAEEVCGVKTFTEVEDRPVVVERVERVLEHHPVEKQFVVETKYVGEQPVPSAGGATVIGATERVVEAAEPGPRCPAGTGAIMDEAIAGMAPGAGTATGTGTGTSGRV